MYKLGLDIGSTTIKLVVLEEDTSLLYHDYRRHLSDIKHTMIVMVQDCFGKLGTISCSITITGSSGLSIAKWLDIPFVQEVIACSKAVEVLIPQTDVMIELGGEDAKITYIKGGMEQRMNSSCAGGTGAFIDQMAVLLDTDASGLNEYAKTYKVIHPIASRCGVFAKTDIQPLLNDGVRKEDIAASIFQAVVNQTISGLACGRPIKGKVAFLGGPLCFLSELKNRFQESLHLSHEDVISPENSQLFVAIGAGLSCSNTDPINLNNFYERVLKITEKKEEGLLKLEPLFQNEQEYTHFIKEHQVYSVKKEPLELYEGACFLGIDAGSTTTKVVLVGTEGQLLFSFYSGNKGNPLNTVITILKDLYSQMPKGLKINKCVVTGYGEALIKAALHGDIGEVETMAHYKGAEFFLPGVDFILDIGGQDMKCLRIKNGVIDHILLNEACSSGCGSFLEGFSHSLNLSVEDLAKMALYAENPVDLGSKCTVFMNSKVKQAQKEGVDIGDLAAGLSYSVIKNALFKVIKMRHDHQIGKKIIVQGGTFYNDAVLRAFEKVSKRKAVRPDIAGLMGAFGAALIAKERYLKGELSSLLNQEQLADFQVKTSFGRCKKCGNQCLLTINHFSNGEFFLAGNRCEKGAGITKPQEKIPNLYTYKYERTFGYTPQPSFLAKRGSMGIPRVLNMFDDYPFWFTLLTKLGFQVILSSPSHKNLYEKGIETIPSDSVCYPAKLCHGHILDLIEKGIKSIFFPSVVREEKEFQDAHDHYNCPVVISYPEVIKNNVDALREYQIKFISPFLTLDNHKVLAKRLVDVFHNYQVTLTEAKLAIEEAKKEQLTYRKDIQKKGEEVISYLKEHHKKGIVLCGKPYHIDPEINHGIPQMITSLGLAVLTEDSISHLAPLEIPLRVVDQWIFNSRLYRAASYLTKEPCLDMVQLNSFGCGLDSVTTDQISEILSCGGKMYTMLKIDEGNNLGAAKIRIRSLKAAMEDREMRNYEPVWEKVFYHKPVFTKRMRQQHTILAPQMSPIHFELIEAATKSCGYQLEVLPPMDQLAIEEGLKYVNNDACYPAIIMVGQIIRALKSGKYNLEQTSVIISQTGGGCRATNYIGFLKLGLKQAGFSDIPIISLNVCGMEKQPGFKLSLGLIHKCIMALVLGDLFMRVLFRTRPYEVKKGDANTLYQKWNEKAIEVISRGRKREFNQLIGAIITDFDTLELRNIQKPKVAVVGEILVKYHPTANNNIVQILEDEGAEAVVPDLLDFFYYSSYNHFFQHQYLAGKNFAQDIASIIIRYLKSYQKTMKESLEKSQRFMAPTAIEELAQMAAPMVSLGNQTGEGWLVTAEMIEYMKHGIHNVICVQPLACLPNHIVGKGMFKPIKERFPHANIIPIDYDPGISQVNQLNRIKLMMSVARKNE